MASNDTLAVKGTSNNESMTLMSTGTFGVKWLSYSHINDQFCDESCQILVVGTPRLYNTSAPVCASDIAAKYISSGQAFVNELAGQFLIVVADRKNESVLVFNDHLGTIPLYWRKHKQDVYLASRMSDLEQHFGDDLELDPQALYNYVYFHCIPSPLTIYAGIRKLGPGACLGLNSQAQDVHTYYLPEFERKTENLSAAQKSCMTNIEQAVGHYTDTECAAFLSGGLDSSTVAGMLAKHRSPAKTFSVGFNEPGYDETEYAEISAQHFGTTHESVYLEPAFIRDNFAKVASAFDEPFGNSSALAAYFCARHAKSKGVDVMLAGDGGDELFAGNSRYAKQKLFHPYERLPGIAKSLLKGVFHHTPAGKISLGSKASSYIEQAENPLPDRLQAYNFLHRFAPEDVFCEEVLQDVDKQQPLQQLRERFKQAETDSDLNRMLFMDWKFTLSDNDLIKVSKMCELAGVEVHFPLIEKELVDFSCTIAADDKLPGQKLRHFFKQSAASFLAPETLNKSKHGFGLPFGRWMRNDPGLVDVTMSALTALRERNIVKPAFIDKALEMQSSEHSAYYGELIWILTVLELWLQSRGR